MKKMCFIHAMLGVIILAVCLLVFLKIGFFQSFLWFSSDDVTQRYLLVGALNFTLGYIWFITKKPSVTVTLASACVTLGTLANTYTLFHLMPNQLISLITNLMLFGGPLLLFLSQIKLPKSLPSGASSHALQTGKVKWFSATKGFGFLTCDDGRDVFVHIRSVQNKNNRVLVQGQPVQFIIVEQKKGDQAEQVVPLDDA